MLCLFHRGLPGADRARQTPLASKPIETATAEGIRQRNSGHFTEALQAFQRAARVAHDSDNVEEEAKALLSASACHIRLFQYRAALETSEQARELALRTNRSALAGAATGNLATIYSQLGDFLMAEREGESSVELLRHSGRNDYLVKAFLSLGQIQAERGNKERSRHSFQQSISLAQHSGLPESEAIAWFYLGRSYLDLGELREADRALTKAQELQRTAHDEDSLAVTTATRAELEYRRGDFPTALKSLDAAFAARSAAFSTSPQYEPVHLRALILLKLGRKSEALAQFRRAVYLATEWRHGALPGDATSTRTSSHLHEVYNDYIELSAQLSLERHDSVLKREAWEVLAESRASSLREQMSLSLGQDGRLPPEYYELLSKLQDAQARFTLGQNTGSEANVRQIWLELSSLENQIGIQPENSTQQEERIFHKKSLRSIQLRLTTSELLLSFCLGKRKSFVWTVTRDRVEVRQLPGEAEIAKQAQAFTRAVQYAQNASESGRSLGEKLFGTISAHALQKPNWLIAGDGALLNGVPFSALPPLAFSPSNAPLAATHTLRFLPSELLLLRSKAAVPERRFLGIADPIYNLADSRRVRHAAFLRAKHTGSLALARLAGSDGEIRRAAKLSGMPETQLLVGADASGTAVRAALLKKPEVIHFAVHVVSPNSRPEEAALALSLTAEDMPELLTPETIAAYRVPGSLVVLSGCSSQQGEILPSAGLIGLSRAWLLAGASAVVVSAWPTPDDSGRFFSSFYSHFQPTTSSSGSLSQRAAAALQQAQSEMQRSNGHRSSPSFWAAYSVISKE